MGGRNDDNDVATGDDIKKPARTKTGMPVKEAEKKNKAKNGIIKKPIRKAGKEEMTKAPNSQPVEYYLKHKINGKIIEGLVDNHRFNNSLSRARVRKIKGRTYNFLPRGPVYEPILRKKRTRKEDIKGNFKIPYIKEDKKRPFILGTSFLTTAKAMIKFDKGTIVLRSGKSKISFHRIHESLCKGEKGIKNDIEPIAPIMTINRLVLEWEEKI
nr:hypothetical protein [Tanacetum cinerariifolium]